METRTYIDEDMKLEFLEHEGRIFNIRHGISFFAHSYNNDWWADNKVELSCILEMLEEYIIKTKEKFSVIGRKLKL